ncbi:Hypothetical protein R9X50_00537000 [Acrodontium crateriforme]|uniref:Uncharacterized protein n=1 Tax=Acrodontium crateriforme TaxID=150365 RepID=A0AAQ3RBG5_9PEZI|nr:Hypothetical protein R9X50_00537000 [Acrodontium crateriforme]
MAEPASDELSSATQQIPADRVLTDAPTSNSPSHQPTPFGFQAVNSRAVMEKERALSAAAEPQGDSTPNPTSVAQRATTQQTTRQASESSNTPNLSSHVDGAADGVSDSATYGTRSRNRTGNARPNYAEDQDMDYEYSNPKLTKKQSDAALLSAASAQADSKPSTESSRFVAVNGNGGSSSASGAKASTPTANATSGTTGKKRKATAASNSQAATPPTNMSPAPSATRKTGGLAALSVAAARETNVMTFHKHKACLNKRGELVADDGTKLSVNGRADRRSLAGATGYPAPLSVVVPEANPSTSSSDHVYLVCEPPGDPYYLCRIMEFLHVESDNPNSPIDAIRANWYYRPRDVQRFNSDSRLVYGTMHSDICPITSLRGRCEIKHRSEIDDFDAYRKDRDTFYFVQVFDRFIRRWYECIPVSQVINVPENVKKALDERWKFVVVENGRVKELTSAVKTCKRCAQYCASSDSVDCAICKNSYHMNCVQPPLPKKPSRGFAWACAPCSRAEQRQAAARDSPAVSGEVTEAEEEPTEEEERIATSTANTRAPSPDDSQMAIDDHPATQAEIALAKMWPMRYLGIHCRVEDALQYDDRAIYPRASSRLGPRHQAITHVWHGHPVELVKTAEIKKRYNKNSAAKTQPKMTKEQMAAMEADREEKAKRPKWVQDEPQGYVARGEDYPANDPRCTAKPIFIMPSDEVFQKKSKDDRISSLPKQSPELEAAKNLSVDDYVKRAKPLSRNIGVPPFGVNFLDKALELLATNGYDQDAALKQLNKVDRVKDLHEPVLSKAELTKFEEGVAKYGSEHRLVRLHMKTNLPNSDIVRFYYLWKKTPKGREIWGNYGGRKGSKKKVENDAGARLQLEVAHDVDDSAFDREKAIKKNRGFECKFCHTHHARQWRKAPGVSAGQTVTITIEAKNGAKEKKEKRLLALCSRCAGLWRRYAIQWEEMDEVAKKVAIGGGKAWKKRIDEELMRELLAASDAANAPQEDSGAVQSIEAGEPPKKKSKTDAATKKEKAAPPKDPTPPIIPTEPQWRALPCAVCRAGGDTVSCAHCKLTVHPRCFGLGDSHEADDNLKWICDQCQNDRNPSVSTDYACCLCLTEETLTDLIEIPKTTHKKKADRDKEKDRLEKELADAKREEYRQKQIARNRPVLPREPLKRTTGNNWVHVYCATWTPEIRFSSAKHLEVAEGFQNIPAARYEAVCKLCKNKDHQNRVRENAGACVSCFQCQANFHASCAFEAGYTFGFDVTPVKGSRKDQITTAKLGEESGALTAGIWCKEHVVKTIIHPMNEVVEASGKTALQVYVEAYKQADLTLTGTVRKANLAQLTKDKGQQSTAAIPANSGANSGRKESIQDNGGPKFIGTNGNSLRRGARTSSVAEPKADSDGNAVNGAGGDAVERRCIKCKIDVTPRWHLVVKDLPVKKEPTPPKSPTPRKISPERVAPPPPPPPEPPKQPNTNNIRFMAPGASGRAWEGMPDRFASRHTSHSSEPQNSSAPRERRTPDRAHERINGVETHHAHALPTFNNPAHARSTTPPGEKGPKPDDEYLCHKCFIKKKLEPTPPPQENIPQAFGTSPPRQHPLPPDWNRAPEYQPPGQPYRMPWDQPPPHQMPIAPNYGPPPTQQGYPYGQPLANGYHPGPPPPQSIHDRHAPLPGGPYGFTQPHPPPNKSPYTQHAGPPRPPINGYAPPPLPNGITSPRTAPRQSPSYTQAVPQHQHTPYGPPPPQLHGEPPYAQQRAPSHLPVMGQHPPVQHGSPSAPPPPGVYVQPPPPQYASPHNQHAAMAAPTSALPPPAATANPNLDPALRSGGSAAGPMAPAPSAAAHPPSGIPPNNSAAVQAGQQGAHSSGASASPSLRNLLD